MSYHIALIPGDGIGKEVVPEAVRVLESLAKRHGFQIRFTPYPYSCSHFLEHGVMMPDDGIEKLRGARRHFPGRGGGSAGARPRLPVGAADPHPAPAAAVREPQTGTAAAGRRLTAGQPHTGGHRFLHRAGKQRGRVFGDRRAHVRRHRPGDGDSGIRLHPPGSRSRPALCLRTGSIPAAATSEFGHQVQRDHPHHALLGRAFPRPGTRVPGCQDGSVSHRHSDGSLRAAPGLVRRGGGQQPVRRHPFRPGTGLGRQHRDRRFGQSQSRAGFPVHVRARARFRPRHRRKGGRQPHRNPLVGPDDAGFPGGKGSGPGADDSHRAGHGKGNPHPRPGRESRNARSSPTRCWSPSAEARRWGPGIWSFSTWTAC